MPIEHDFDIYYNVSPTERLVLVRVAVGQTNREIAHELKHTEGAVRGILERFRNRTGLAGRRLVAWCAHHEEFCLAE